MFKLEVKNLAKRFDTRVVFNNIHFSLETGQSLAVVGPNGSGKTTLLRTIIGLLPPSKGKVVFSIEDRELNFDDYRKKLSLVAPYMSLYGSLTARENLRFLSKVDGKNISDEKIEMALNQVGLDGRGEDYFSTYSSGMQQRLKYAAVILKNPSVLLIDEPTTNLDTEGKKIIFDLIKSYKPDSILIIATNEREEAALAEATCQLGG